MQLLFSFILIALGIFVIWRLASNRHALPCPSWLRWLVELDNPFTKVHHAATIIANLDLKPGMTVLDAGCGPGRLTIPLSRQVGEKGHVVAMDIQHGMLNQVQSKARAAGLQNISYLQAGIGDGKLDSRSFDSALLVTVLGEITDRGAAMSEIFNVLKPGGILSITEIIFDPHFQRRQTVVNLAEAAGFREKAFYGRRMAYTLHFEKPEPAGSDRT